MLGKVKRALDKAYNSSDINKNTNVLINKDSVFNDLLEQNTLLNLTYRKMDNPIDIVLPKEYNGLPVVSTKASYEMGQTNIAKTVLSEMGLDIPVFGMVKDEKHRTRGLVSESGEIDINPQSSSFRLISAIQDSVHRLAIGYHRKLSEKNMVKSPLLSLKGVGNARYEKLLKTFKSVNKMKAASKEDLIKTVGKTAGESVYKYLHEIF